MNLHICFSYKYFELLLLSLFTIQPVVFLSKDVLKDILITRSIPNFGDADSI